VDGHRPTGQEVEKADEQGCHTQNIAPRLRAGVSGTILRNAELGKHSQYDAPSSVPCLAQVLGGHGLSERENLSYFHL
jgi:hypothetical protein